MIPDDESVRRAMQHIEPAGTDVPDLFDRVAVGARRRRRHRSIGAVSAAAVAVAAVALVPALGHHNSSTNTQPAGPGPVASSSPGVNSSQLRGAPPILGPSSIGSPAAVVSPLAVGSPLSSTSATTPSLPIATGTCAPGLTATAQVLPFGPSPVTAGANTLHLYVGELVTFKTSGPCAAEYFYYPSGGTVFGALLPGSVFHADGLGEDLTATATGTEVLSLRQQDSSTGPTLATITVTVGPATVINGVEVASGSPTPLPTNSAGCPTAPANGLAADVSGIATQEAAVFDAVAAQAQKLYGSASSDGTVQITAIYRAVDHTGFGIVADSICGKTLGDESYVVELHIPNAMNSASIGSGQVFVAQFATGWQVWLRYH
jgi:hypothetical protein